MTPRHNKKLHFKRGQTQGHFFYGFWTEKIKRYKNLFKISINLKDLFVMSSFTYDI
jgi:hypothetical protein